MKRRDHAALVTDAGSEIAELDDVDARFAQIDFRVEQLRERGGGVAGTDVADFFERVFLEIVQFERLRTHVSTLLMVSRIFGG